MDRLTALRVFREVAESNNFAQAGRRLGLSPPAISKNIKELEDALGVRLIDRTTRRMHLTEAGKQYLLRVTHILDELAEADRALQSQQHAPSGTLRVSVPASLTLTCLSRAIPRFLSQHPDLKLKLDLDDRHTDLLREGYDLAIRGSDALEDSSLVARKLMTMPHVLCGAPQYFAKHGVPQVPDDLVAHCCIQYSLSSHANQWEFRKGGRSRRVQIDGRYQVSSSLAVHDALRAGFGVSVIPAAYVRQDLKQRTLRAVLEDWSTVEGALYAVYPSRRHVPAKITAFVDFVAEALAAPAA